MGKNQIRKGYKSDKAYFICGKISGTPLHDPERLGRRNKDTYCPLVEICKVKGVDLYVNTMDKIRFWRNNTDSCAPRISELFELVFGEKIK